MRACSAVNPAATLSPAPAGVQRTAALRAVLTTHTAAVALLMLALACLCVMLGGYAYGVDDQDTDFAIIRRVMDPGHLANDWYLNTQGGFASPRYAYALIVAATARWTSLPVACAVWYVLLLALLLGAAHHMAVTLYASPRCGFFAALVLALSLAHSKSALGYALWPKALVAQCFATTIAAWTYAFFLQGRITTSACLAALGVWIHGQAGNHALVIVAIAACAQQLRRGGAAPFVRGEFVKAVVLAIVLAAPAEFHLLRHSAMTAGLDELIAHLKLRLPQHFVPSEWPAHQVGGIVGAAALILFHRFNGSEPPIRRMRTITGLIVVLSAAYVVSFMYRPAGLIIKAHFARHASMLVLLAAPVVANALLRAGQRAGILAVAASSAAFLLLLPETGGMEYWVVLLLLGGSQLPTMRCVLVTAIVASGAAVVWNGVGPAGRAMLAAAVPVTFIYLERWVARQPILPRFAATCVTVVLAALMVLPGSPLNWQRVAIVHALRFSLRGPISPAEQLARRAAELTPADAVLVLPPESMRARLFSQRACVASFESNPYWLSFVPEWRQRIWACALGCAEDRPLGDDVRDLREAYRKITRSGLDYLHEAYGATHAIVPPGAPAGRGAALAEAGGWKLVRIAGPLARSEEREKEKDEDQD